MKTKVIRLNKDGSMPKLYRKKLCKLGSEVFNERMKSRTLERPIGFCDAIRRAINMLPMSIQYPQGHTLHKLIPEFAAFKPDKIFDPNDYWYLKDEGRKREIIFDIVNHKLNS